MSIKRIVLTGGTGMVGRNIQDFLGNTGLEVLAPTRNVMDLKRYESVMCYLLEHSPDLVIHAAGKVGGIQANINDPVGFLIDNIDLGRNLVCAALEAGVTRVLNIGSSCMYPRNIMKPLREEMVLSGELEPTNEGYALAKIVTARLCKYITQQNSNLLYKTIIPCNLYGKYDNFDHESAHLIPAIIRKIHRSIEDEIESVEIWGDGEARREFMYAGDFASAVGYAIENFSALPLEMNLGTGSDLSVNEYYRIVADVLGYRGTFIHNTSKPTGMSRKLVCIQRQRDWGWMPSWSLEKGISITYDYYIREFVL